MKLTFVQTATFVTLWKYWRLDDSHMRALEQQIMDAPLSGVVMRHTGGIRKIRFAPQSRGIGKSGGFRVCYFYVPAHEIIYFVLVFPKNEQPNLTAEQEKACRVLSRQIKDELDRQSRKNR